MIEPRERRGSAADLHGADLLAEAPGIWLLRPERPALVLGSTQPDDAVVVGAGSSWEVCRRRSGGGVVHLDPAAVVWVDVVIDRDHPHWADDVVTPFVWLGQAWARSFVSLGRDARVHSGPPVAADLGRVACFAGVGHGEVTIGGRKVVGLSQRRDRRGARVQCVAYRTWDPAPIVDAFGPGVPSEVRPEVERRLRDDAGSAPDIDAALRAFIDTVSATFA